MPSPVSSECHFAVLTAWSLFAPFGAGFVLSGFRAEDLILGFLGFAIVAAGAVSHLVINRVYGVAFSDGQIAVAAGIFLVALLGFLASWIAAPTLAPADVLLGLAGTAIVIAGAFAYVATRYGLRGAFSMFHTKHPT